MAEAPRTAITITVDGRPVESAAGELLIEAVERAGTYIPRFCYHPRMEPVGVCRMCLVEVDGPRGATLQPACFLKVHDGLNVVTDSPKVKKAQDGVLEFLLANHPLDCPVCDKGGECPLQDQTLAHGSGETRFVEEKRHFVKPVAIGELVLLDRERCIQCARCTRFASDVAGDAQIAFAGRGDLIEVAASPTQPFDSVFSGNTVQICPVGALTATPYRFTARPWDLEQVESTCTTCALGCRVAVQSSGNRLTRVLGIDSEPVNHGWLCDKGRYTLGAVDGNEDATDPLSARTRITEPLMRIGGALTPVSWDHALSRAAELLGAASNAGAVGAIGGAALTNEGAFAWERFVRGVLHSEHLDAQYGDGLDAALLQALPRATIDEAAHAPTVVTLCADLRAELPVLFLRLRESALRPGGALVELSFGPSALRSAATLSLTVRPGEAHVVARALAATSATVPPGLAITSSELAQTRQLLGERGEGVVFVVGRANLAEDPAVLETAVRVLAERYPDATFLPVLRRANVMGALDMGWAPGLRPGQGFEAAPTGRGCAAQLAALASGRQRAVLLLGSGLLGNVLDVELARRALDAGDVVVVTGHGGATLDYAEVVLPAAVQHERTGTVTNIEGRVSAVNAKVGVPGSAWSDVAIAAQLAEACGQHLGLTSDVEAARAIEATTGYPALSVLDSPSGDGVVVGRGPATSVQRPLDPMAVPGIRSTDAVGLGSRSGATAPAAPAPALAPARATLDELGVGRGVEVPVADTYSWRLLVTRRLYDDGVAMQGSPALQPLIKASSLQLHHVDLDRLGLRAGDEVRIVGARASVVVTVAQSDAVARGVAELALGELNVHGEDPVRLLVEPGGVVTQVRLESA